MSINKKNETEKIFVISLHRTMTRSVDAYLSILGYRTIHYPRFFKGFNIEEKMRGIEEQTEKIISILTPVIESADALSDTPFPVLYKELAYKWPESKFILLLRDPEKWVQSVRSHVKDRDFRPFDKIQYGHFLGYATKSLRSVSDNDLQNIYRQHTREVKRFFTEQGAGHRLCVIDDIGEAAALISNFLGQPVFEMPWIAGGKKGEQELPSLLYWKSCCPGKADPCYYLAKIYYEQEEYSKARAECYRAVELDPYFQRPRKLLSKIDKRDRYVWIFRLKKLLSQAVKKLGNRKTAVAN